MADVDVAEAQNNIGQPLNDPRAVFPDTRYCVFDNKGIELFGCLNRAMAIYLKSLVDADLAEQ